MRVRLIRSDRGTLHTISFVALIGGATCIAFAPIFVRLSELYPIATAFWRLAFAMPFFWLGFFAQEHRIPSTRTPQTLSDILALLLPGLFFAGDLAVWHWSIRYTSVANATLLANFAPIFVTVGAWLIFKQRITTTFLLGLVMAIVGICILMGTSFRIDSLHVYGDILGIITAVFYGSYILSIKRLREKYSTLTIMAWGGTACCVLLFIFAVVSGDRLIAATLSGWIILLALALVSQVTGQGLIAFALARLPAPFSSVTLLLQPVIAGILAWILLHEGIIPLQGIGALVVLFGIVVARRGSIYI